VAENWFSKRKNSFPVSWICLASITQAAIIADFSPTLFRKIALSVETLLIQPEPHKNTSFWLNKEFNPARIG